MSPALRTSSARVVAQSFSATTPKVVPVTLGIRRLSISGSREASPALNSFESTLSSIPKRSDITPNARTYNTSRTMKQVNDSSTVDFAYIPAFNFALSDAISEYSRIPLLPDNYSVKHQDISPESTIPKAEISTATYTDTVASMSEADVSKSADGMGLKDALVKESSVVKRVWNDFLDDVLGAKKPATSAS